MVFNEQGRIYKYEYYSNDILKVYGEYFWLDSGRCQMKIYGKELNPGSGKEIFKLKYTYDISLESGKVKEYTIHKANEWGMLIRIGQARFMYINEFTEEIKRYHDSQYLGRTVTYFKDGERVQERIYNSLDKITQITSYKNNKVVSIKKYIYSPSGQLLRIEEYDDKGNLRSTSQP